MKKESIFIRLKKWLVRFNRNRLEKAVKNDPYC